MKMYMTLVFLVACTLVQLYLKIVYNAQGLPVPDKTFQERAQEAFDSMKEKAQEALDYAQDVANRAIDSAKATVQEAMDTAQEASKQGFENGRELVEQAKVFAHNITMDSIFDQKM